MLYLSIFSILKMKPRVIWGFCILICCVLELHVKFAIWVVFAGLISLRHLFCMYKKYNATYHAHRQEFFSRGWRILKFLILVYSGSFYRGLAHTHKYSINKEAVCVISLKGETHITSAFSRATALWFFDFQGGRRPPVRPPPNGDAPGTYSWR